MLGGAASQARRLRAKPYYFRPLTNPFGGGLEGACTPPIKIVSPGFTSVGQCARASTGALLSPLAEKLADRRAFSTPCPLKPLFRRRTRPKQGKALAWAAGVKPPVVPRFDRLTPAPRHSVRIPSSARFTLSTFTVGSPNTPRKRPVVYRAMICRTSSSVFPV